MIGSAMLVCYFGLVCGKVVQGRLEFDPIGRNILILRFLLSWMRKLDLRLVG